MKILSATHLNGRIWVWLKALEENRKKIEVNLIATDKLLRKVSLTANTSICVTRRPENTLALCLFGGDKCSTAIHKSADCRSRRKHHVRAIYGRRNTLVIPSRGSPHVFPILILAAKFGETRSANFSRNRSFAFQGSLLRSRGTIERRRLAMTKRTATVCRWLKARHVRWIYSSGIACDSTRRNNSLPRLGGPIVATADFCVLLRYSTYANSLYDK